MGVHSQIGTLWCIFYCEVVCWELFAVYTFIDQSTRACLCHPLPRHLATNPYTFPPCSAPPPCYRSLHTFSPAHANSSASFIIIIIIIIYIYFCIFFYLILYLILSPAHCGFIAACPSWVWHEPHPLCVCTSIQHQFRTPCKVQHTLCYQHTLTLFRPLRVALPQSLPHPFKPKTSTHGVQPPPVLTKAPASLTS